MCCFLHVADHTHCDVPVRDIFVNVIWFTDQCIIFIPTGWILHPRIPVMWFPGSDP